jgi:hypothetical protein
MPGCEVASYLKIIFRRFAAKTPATKAQSHEVKNA